MSGIEDTISATIQGAAENVAADLINNILGFLPKDQEAIAFGENLGDQAADKFEDSILPKVYNRGSVGGYFNETQYQEFLQRIPTNYHFPIDFLGGSIDITLNPRQIARHALPENKFLAIQTNTLDPLTQGLTQELQPRVEKRIKSLAALTGIMGAISGGVITAAYLKLLDSNR